jgi:hypothetical protein
MGSISSIKANKMAARVDETLPSKSIIHWSECEGKKVPVTCGKCGIKRSVKPRSGQRRMVFSGLCFTCSHPRRSNNEKHLSGTIIHWGEREDGGLHRVAITCYACHQKRFTWAPLVRLKEWTGLCPECAHQPRRKWKYVQDEILPSLSIIHWGERDPEDPNRVPVTCGACGKKRTIFRQGFLTTKQKWTGYCQEHTRTEIVLLLQGKVQRSSEQKTRGAEKRGRKEGDLFLNRDTLRTEFEIVVRELRKTYPPTKISRRAIARMYNARGESIHESTVLTRVHMMYGDNVDVADAVALVLDRTVRN